MSAVDRLPSSTARRRRTAGVERPPIVAGRFGSADRAASKLQRASELSQATPGLDLATRLRQFQRAVRGRVEGRDALLSLVRAVSVTLEPTRIAEVIVDQAAKWIPAPSWALVGGGPAGPFTLLAMRGLEPGMDAALIGIGARVVQGGDEFFTANLLDDDRVEQRMRATVLAFPLVCRGRRVGAIIGFDATPSAREPRLSPGIVRGIRVLLEPAAVALDNALLLKRAEALSVTDELTHLYNSRYLHQVLRRETKRSARSGRPLSLIFMDLDGFKGINDTYGHLSGSRALIEVAAVLRGSARETDVVARFGGDEFALVLPDTGAAGGLAVGTRVRERVAAHPFLAVDGLDLHLTASVGVATLPDVAASADALLRAADTAMYAVKDRGKNGVQAAAPADN